MYQISLKVVPVVTFFQNPHGYVRASKSNKNYVIKRCCKILLLELANMDFPEAVSLHALHISTCNISKLYQTSTNHLRSVFPLFLKNISSTHCTCPTGTVFCRYLFIVSMDVNIIYIFVSGLL